MNIMPLKASSRKEIGTQQTKKLRNKKLVPAVVYGEEIQPIPVHVSLDEFLRALHTKAGENVVLRLEISGEKNQEQTVIIKDIQHNPVTDVIRHVDFMTISLTEKIKVNVPLHVTGEGDAPGLKQGGVLDVVHHEIEVECLPTNIPERINVDIAKMEIGDSVHISELNLPSEVTAELSGDEVAVAIHAPKAEEAPAEEEAKAEPEVIGKEKKEGEEEEPQAGGAGEAQPKKEKE